MGLIYSQVKCFRDVSAYDIAEAHKFPLSGRLSKQSYSFNLMTPFPRS